MKTPTEHVKPPPLLGHAGPSGWAETQPTCWRSEAFAEDLYDSLAPVRELPAAGAKPPLLRRALAAVLRR